MPDLTLTNQQKARLTAYITAYLNWLNSPEQKLTDEQIKDLGNILVDLANNIESKGTK